MNLLIKNPVLVGGAVLLLVVVVALARRGAQAGGAGSVFEDLGRGVVGAVEDVAAGVVKGAGAIVGIPDTDPDSCARALADGRLWDASFACPALDFLRGVAGVTPGAPVLDAPVRHGATGEW